VGISNRGVSGTGEVFEGPVEAKVIAGGDRALYEGCEGYKKDD